MSSLPFSALRSLAIFCIIFLKTGVGISNPNLSSIAVSISDKFAPFAEPSG